MLKSLLFIFAKIWPKTLYYSTVYFSKIGSFLEMLITQKIFVGNSSNFPHSIRTSICIRKCNKNWGAISEPIFYIAFAFFQKLAHF